MPQTKAAQRDESSKRQQSGQGRVKDPERDGRLRDNRERGVRKGKSQ